MIQQPADLLPFTGGEHLDTSTGIAFALPDYLQLVDWTGSAVRDDKRGAIPPEIQPIFQRQGLNHEEWLEIGRTSGGVTAWRQGRWIGFGNSANIWAGTGYRGLV